MFIGASLQQFGLLKTTVTNVSFITGLYIVIVPLIGLFLGHRYKSGIWFAISIAAIGLYLLSGMGGFTIKEGDFLVFCSCFSWACHVLIIDYLSDRYDGLKIAAGQFFACAIFSFIAALFMGDNLILTTWNEWKWIIASGTLATGVGFTLQIIGQKYTPPAQAAIILSLESVFGALAGYLFFAEILSLQGFIGAGLMLLGCILAQFFPPLPPKTEKTISSA
jgi:drug/metabolite transporter (DMT)-like permease